MTYSTHDAQMERYALPGPVPQTDAPLLSREDAIENEKSISRLLIELIQARQSIRITRVELAELEKSLGGKARD